MKTLALSRLTRSMGSAIAVFSVALACDQFETDRENPVATIKGIDDVLVYQNSEVIIPIHNVVSSPGNVTISCTQKPKRGYLEIQPNGRFKYAPYLNELGSDSVVFSIRSRANGQEVLPQQVVQINIKPPRPVSGCSPVANRDIVRPSMFGPNIYYEDLQGQEEITIYVAANDQLCHWNYNLSIYKPSDQSMPHAGTASSGFSVDASWIPGITYRRFGSSWKTDTIMYKLVDRTDPSSVAYGMVYIMPECEPELRHDFLAPAAEGVWPEIDVLANDDLCNPKYDYSGIFSITQPPKHGKVDYSTDYTYYDEVWETIDGKIKYSSTDLSPWTYDTIVYKVCEASFPCMLATVVVSNQPNECAPLAHSDRFVYRDEGQSTFVFDVLANDQICGDTPVLYVRNQAQHGIVEIDAGGLSIKYKPKHMLGDSFEYVICTEKGCSAAMVYLDRK